MDGIIASIGLPFVSKMNNAIWEWLQRWWSKMDSLSTVLYALRRSGVDSRDNITVTYIEPIHLKELKGLQIKKRDTGKIIMFL